MQLVHLSAAGGTASRCGAPDGRVVSWEQVTDPADESYFDCGDCLTAVRGETPEPVPGQVRS